METVTITRPACREVLERRLADCLRDREARQQRGAGYGKNLSDQWLERDISELHGALLSLGVPADAK